ncbi:MAG: Na+/H+ antiporter NhaC family protein [Bacteroidetes bacterium]|nr:Na+/H+ antiporter NhaC family protein [Bacteroidota bacterium]
MSVFGRTISLFCFILLFLSISAFASEKAYPSFEVEIPKTIIQHIPVEIEIVFLEPKIITSDTLSVKLGEDIQKIVLVDGRYIFSKTFDSSEELVISAAGFEFQKLITPVPLWMSVLPPLFAILIALIFREVYVALFVGVWMGSVIITYYQGYTIFGALFYGLFSIIDVYILESLNDSAHLSIIVFSMMIGAMVTLISDNGGMQGVVNYLARFARGPRSGQFVTWLMGMAIFFDDYANTLVVGNTMRPVADRLGISREKLSYIVDSTAAPIASIAFVTTWIGAELSYIQDGIRTLSLNETAYDVFLNSLQYSFYPILALGFVLILILSRRDFGPMLKAERLMLQNGVPDYHPGVNEEGQQKKGIKERWYNAVIPVVVIVGGTIAGLISTGLENTSWDPTFGFVKNISNIIGHSDSYRALLWSSLAGVLVAVLLTVGQRILSLRESVESLISGFKTMITAVLILVLAWSIALITKYMHTADFISNILLEVNIAPYVIPSITFILAALVAFATGSSWGTMAILYPLILPSSWLIAQESGLDYDQSMAIFHNVVSTVLAGSVLGDHCSPISDTTILSSLASSCNHIEHVRTQLPYALVVGGVGVFAGTLPAAYGVPTYILFPIGILILVLILRVFGRKSNVQQS